MAWRMWLRVTSWQTIQMKNIWSILYCDVTKDCMMMNMRWHWELLETKQPAGCNQDFVEERSSRQESAAHPQFLRSFFNLLDTNTIQIRMDANTNMYWAHHRRSCCSSHSSGGHINCILYIIQRRHDHQIYGGVDIQYVLRGKSALLCQNLIMGGGASGKKVSRQWTSTHMSSNEQGCQIHSRALHNWFRLTHTSIIKVVIYTSIIIDYFTH